METECAIAWAAGLFEGEGSFSVRTANSRQAVITIASTDRDVIERFAEVVQGENPVRGPNAVGSSAKGFKPIYRWQSARWAEIKRIGELMRPWLSERRTAQLDKVLSFCPPDLEDRPRRITGILCEPAVRPSKAGYLRHWRRGEPPCDTCRESYALWTKTFRKARDPEKVRAQNRASYLKNREARVAWQRAYKARKKAERQEAATSEIMD